MPMEPNPSNIRTRTVDDPMALRALAHPLRRKLQGLVAREGTLTAADAARQLGISHALASHHLRQLAKYGFVEAADAEDDRARPWQISATSMTFDTSDPDASAPNDLLQRQRIAELATELAGWQQRRPNEDPRWREITGVLDSLLYLDPDELGEVIESWFEIVRARAAERPVGHAARRPAGAAPVSLTLIAIPLVPTERGG